MTAWRDRPELERTALNPALVAKVLHEAAIGYNAEAGQGLPYYLTFLVVPAVFHAPTRKALPDRVTSSLASWLGDHPVLRQDAAPLANGFAPYAREGLQLALSTGMLVLDGAEMRPRGGRTSVPRSDLPELHRLLKAGRFVGRWYGRVNSPSTVFALWGVQL